MFGGVLALLLATSAAHAQVFTEPQFLYNDGSTPYETTLAAAWADEQASRNYCLYFSNGSSQCQTALNLRPQVTGDLGITEDGIYYLQNYDTQWCTTPAGGTPSCNSPITIGFIQATYVCPTGTSAAIYEVPGSYDPRVRTVYCRTPDPAYVQPPSPPKGCLSCLGNPIYAGSGEKFQVEQDYNGRPGMSFARTYRSNPGRTFSLTNTAFADYSQTMGTLIGGCYPGSYVIPASSTNVGGCFPYISVGQNLYQLATADGRFIQFSGPNNAVAQNADINERVTQISVGGMTEWQVTRDDDSVELYSTAGRLLQKTLRGGQVITYTYSTSSTPSSIAPGPGYLISQSDPFGHALSWTYNASGQMTQMTDPAGGIYQYTYDGIGNLNGVTYPDSTTRTYWYNESANTGGTSLPGALTGITDESGVRFATYQYAATWYPSGVAVSTQHAGGVDSYTFAYDAASYYYGNAIRTAVVTDPLGASRTYNLQRNLSYNYDAGQVQPAASGSGTVAANEYYDANGNRSWSPDFNQIGTNSGFDLTRNLEIWRIEAYGMPSARTITTQWSPNFRLPTVISVYAGGYQSANPGGTPLRTTAFSYDGSGSLLTKTVTDTTVTPNVSRTWTYTYNSFGRMLTVKGPRTDVNSTTTYTYYTCTTGYQCGELHTVTDAVGNVTTYNTYNANGQPLTITDPNGVVTTLTYDGRQRLTSRQVGSETTSFSYHPTGLLKKVTLPDSSYIQYSYDGAHRLTQISDGAGNSIQYTLDAMGNRTAEKVYDPSSVLHRTHTRAYNSLNDLYQDINAAGTSTVTTTFGYDDNANQTSIAAPLNRNTTNAYDALNRLTRITDPANGSTYFSYDPADDLTSVKDPRNLTTNYGYNSFGDLTTQVSPDTGTTTNTYDSGGSLATSTDARGAISTYAYDALNRVTSIGYQSGGVADQTLVFSYDAGTNGKGRLTSASDANHALSWTYDGLGRVTGKGLTVGTVSKSVGYGYTNADLTAVVTPSGQNVVYGYNSNHQVVSVTVNGTTVLSGVTYEPFGVVSGWTWGNGSTSTRSFNTDGLISQIVSAGVTLGYGYDNANRISGITDSSNGTLSWTYGYDALDRLTSATTNSITDGWTYDANGNRMTQTGTNPITFSVNSGNNQLSSTSGSLVRSYSYDAAGNAQAYGSYAFGYNNRGRMMATNAGSTNYLYNALGQMIEKSGTAGTTIFMQDESGHLIGEYDGSGNLIEETIWLGDIPVATLQFGTSALKTYYVHTDHLNTPRRITNRNTNIIVWRWDSDPFGNGAAVQNPQGTVTVSYNLRFRGQYYDAETGLSQNYFRDFDPAVGRYTESDPIGLAGGYSTYAYGLGNPLSNSDPDGLRPPRSGAPGISIPLPLPPIAIPGTPENTAWAQSAYQQISDALNPAASSCKVCPECSPYKKGTIGYIGPHADHDHYPIGRPHLNLFVVNQNASTCKCFWNKNNPDVAKPPPDLDWVDLNPGFPPLSP